MFSNKSNFKYQIWGLAVIPFLFSFDVIAHHGDNPPCASASSDADGDGWGWENDHSCRVVTDTNIDTTAPNATVNPYSGSLVAGDISFEGTATDNVGGSGVQWLQVQIKRSSDNHSYNGNGDWQPSDAWTSVYNGTSNWSITGNFEAGEYTVIAHVGDAAGNDDWANRGERVFTVAGQDSISDSTPTPTMNPTDDVIDETIGEVPGRFANDPWGIFDAGQPWANDDVDTNQATLTTNFDTNPWLSLDDDNFPARQVPDYFDYFAPHESNNFVGRDTPASTNGEAQFRIFCGISHFQQVDPIVNPTERSGHLHMFWGNTLTDQNSEVGSGGSTDISQHGLSTCQGGAYNRSAYWMPALLTKENGPLEVVIPEKLHIYYKGRDVRAEPINELPLGIQLLGGNIDMPRDARLNERSDKNDLLSVNPDYPAGHSYTGRLIPNSQIVDSDFVHWGCYSGEGEVHPLTKKPYILSSEVCRTARHSFSVAPGCSESKWKQRAGQPCKRYTAMEATIRFPQCLEENPDGTPVLFSDNNVDHFYARLSWNENGEYTCPDSHSYRIPQITYRVRFNIPGSDKWEDDTDGEEWSNVHSIDTLGDYSDTMATWHLSSDHHGHTDEADFQDNRGWSLHGDWLGAWNEELMSTWIDGCFQQDVAIGQREAQNCDGGRMDANFGLSNVEGSSVLNTGETQMKYDGKNHSEGYTRRIGPGQIIMAH